MTEELTTNVLSKAIHNDDALTINRTLGQYMNNYLSLKLDELEESIDLIPDNTETDIEVRVVGSLEMAARSLGADPEIHYEQGTMIVSFQKKQALENFLDWIDTNCEYVEDYEVSAFHTDAADQVEELVFDDISNDDPWKFELAVYLIPEIVTFYPEYELEEGMKRVLKVNSRGDKRIKMQCSKGFKWNEIRHSCEKITGVELATKRQAVKKAVRTKKSMGNVFKVRMVKKMKKAKKFRKGYGLK